MLFEQSLQVTRFRVKPSPEAGRKYSSMPWSLGRPPRFVILTQYDLDTVVLDEGPPTAQPLEVMMLPQGLSSSELSMTQTPFGISTRLK